MHSHDIQFRVGPAEDVLIYFDDVEIFATPQTSYLIQSPNSLSDDETTIILDASYWWFDSGRSPEILRVERHKDRVHLIGGRHFEQIPGDSYVSMGSISFAEWLDAVRALHPKNQSAEQVSSVNGGERF